MVSKLALSVLVMTVVLVALSESRPKKLCCTRYQKTRVSVKLLKSYVIQEITGYCNIKAVIFRTLKNKRFCADPKKKWVREAMKTVPQE